MVVPTRQNRVMKTPTLLILLLLSLAWMSWPQRPARMLTMFTGRPDTRVVEVMRSRGANFEVTQRGMKIAYDQTSFECIYDVMRFHQKAADVCATNLANAQNYATAEGTPYRRQFLTLNKNGSPELHIDDSDFNWVYDPGNPRACQNGEHKGYVAAPNVSVLVEMNSLRRHQKMADCYAVVLKKFEATHPDLVIFLEEVELSAGEGTSRGFLESTWKGERNPGS